MVLDQIPLTMPAPLGEAPPVFEQRDGRGDEAATKITARQDLVRRNRLRREENSSLRGSHELHQQRRTQRKHNPYAPVSRNHHDQQGLGQEHRKIKRRAEGLPEEEAELSFEPEIPKDEESSLPSVYRPSNGSCPVIPHDSNSAVLQEDRENAAPSTAIVGGLSVWARLQQAATASSRLRCPSPRCCQVSACTAYHCRSCLFCISMLNVCLCIYTRMDAFRSQSKKLRTRHNRHRLDTHDLVRHP